MPIGVERATQKPHADMQVNRVVQHDCIWHIQKASTVAAVLTPIEIFQISNRQERALVNAF